MKVLKSIRDINELRENREFLRWIPAKELPINSYPLEKRWKEELIHSNYYNRSFIEDGEYLIFDSDKFEIYKDFARDLHHIIEKIPR